MNAQHAGHALADRGGDRGNAPLDTPRSSLIKVGRKPVVPNFRCAAPMLRMASGVGSSLKNTPPPPLTWVSMNPGSSI